MIKSAGFILLTLLLCSTVMAQTTLIPRRGRAPHKPAQAYELLKGYLSDPLRGGFFRIVRGSSANRLLVAERDQIDTKNWTDWAYCKLGGSQLLYKLKDGRAIVSVKIAPSGRSFSDVSVTADFKGTYGLGSSERRPSAYPAESWRTKFYELWERRLKTANPALIPAATHVWAKIRIFPRPLQRQLARLVNSGMQPEPGS